MTIEIEAGASQGQFSMKPLGSARIFRRPALEPQDIHDRCRFGAAGHSRRNLFVFQRETPSLSLRLRSVRYARADSDVLRTSSNRVRSRSVCISDVFEIKSGPSSTVRVPLMSVLVI